MAVLAEKEKTMNEMIRDMNLVREEYGMRIWNKKKAKCVVIKRGGKRTNIKTGQDKIQEVELFKYLGSLISEDMSCTCLLYTSRCV